MTLSVPAINSKSPQTFHRNVAQIHKLLGSQVCFRKTTRK